MWIQKVPGGGVVRLAYAPDGGTLYTLDAGGCVTAWDVAARRPHRLGRTAQRPLSLHAHLCTTADGRLLVSRAGDFRVWEVASGAERPWSGPAVSGTSYVHVRPDGRVYFAGPTNRALAGWNAATDRAELPLTPTDEVPYLRSFELSPDGRLAVLTFLDATSPRLYEVGDAGELRNPVPIAGVGRARDTNFSPDGRTLAVFAYAEARVSLWDVPARAARVTGIEAGASPFNFAFNPVHPLFAARGTDGVLALWRLDDPTPVRALDFALGRSVTCVAFSPDGLTCAVGGSNKQFAVFDVDV